MLVASSLGFTSEAHWLASLNSCKMRCLTITPLVGVVALNHIQISTSDVLSEPSSSCQMVAGTHSGLCCHKDSIAIMLSGVPSQILKHGGFFDWYTSHTCCMSACMSHVHHVGAISFTISTIFLKNRSIVGHRSNHCAFFRLVLLSGQGNCLVCDSGGSPAVNGSLLPRRLAKCSSTGLHRNPTDDSPGGGRSVLGDDPKTLFFIMM